MRFWLGMGLLGVGLVVLLLTNPGGEIMGLSQDRFAALIAALCILILIGSGIFKFTRRYLFTAVKQILIWGIILIGLVVAFAFAPELRQLGEQFRANLNPQSSIMIQPGTGAIVLFATTGGQYETIAFINGVQVPVLIDTGASSVVLASKDAAKLGLNIDELNYSVPVTTANGQTRAAFIRLTQISIGTIVRKNIDALIAQPGGLKQSLLGMSFLEKVRFEMNEGRLTLHP